MFLDDFSSQKSISISLICSLRCKSGRVHLYAEWELEELHLEASADKVQRSISIWTLAFIQMKWYQDNGAVTDIIHQSWSVKSCDLFELYTCISQIKTWRRTSLSKGRGRKPKEHAFPSSSRYEENANVQGQMKQGACEWEEGEDWLSSKDQWDGLAVYCLHWQLPSKAASLTQWNQTLYRNNINGPSHLMLRAQDKVNSSRASVMVLLTKIIQNRFQ